MNAPEQNKQVKQIFLELSDLPPDQRDEELAARCGTDEQLRNMVQALLDADDLGQQLDAGPTIAIAPPAFAPCIDRPQHAIGPYKILQQIGEGGFAQVYLAEQESPVRRRVALKVLKPGMDSASVVARFDAERQALALMNHPNVAKVFDAGVAESGRPYFVMEYVPGESITAFCDRQHYSIRQRLELFCQACAAVQHAHQKAIIHRDLKPSNILVMADGDAPLVKVIDFGMAKALAQPLTERTLYTHTGQLVGTPEYMSPEQAEMGPLDVDTRSDVYSLGVVLYELLCGALPFDSSSLRSAGCNEVQRIIREVEPPRPSTRLSSLTERAAGVAQNRRAHLTTLERELRSELEWIPLKAMRKERDRRYASALQLAEDIGNYLASRPLLAGPESRVYRVRKFARRNRGSIAAAGALLVALLLGMVTTSAMYVRAEHERRETQRQKEIAQARFDDVRKLANTFLFDVHDQIEDLAGATPARALLVRTALEYLEKLSAQAGDDHDLLREILQAYGRVGDVQGNPNFGNLGDTRGALHSYRKALAIAQQLADADRAHAGSRLDLAVCHTKIGDVLAASGERGEALRSYREALRIAGELADADPTDMPALRHVMVTHVGIGDIFATSGDTRGALDVYRRSLELAEKLVDANPTDPAALRDLARGHDRIGNMLAAVGDAGAALESHRRAQGIAQILADAHPDNADLQRNLAVAHDKIAVMLFKTGTSDGAMATLRASLAIRQKLADADPTNAKAQRDLLACHDRTGAMHAATGDIAAALQSYRQMQTIARKLADADPANAQAQRDLAASYNSIGEMLTASGNSSAAVESYRKAAGIARKLVDADPTNVLARSDLAFSHGGIGDLLVTGGDPAAAMESYRTVLSIAQDLADADPENATFQRNLWVAFNKMSVAFGNMAGDETKAPRERIPLYEEARAWYLREEAQAEAMKQRNLLSPSDAKAAEARRGKAARYADAIEELTAADPPPSSDD